VSKTALCLCLIVFCFAFGQALSLNNKHEHAKVREHRAGLQALAKREAQIAGEREALERMLTQTKMALTAAEQKDTTAPEIEHDNDIANLNLNRIISMITSPVPKSTLNSDAVEGWNKAAANAKLLSSPSSPLTTNLHEHAQPVTYFTPERFVEEQNQMGVGTAQPSGPGGAGASGAGGAGAGASGAAAAAAAGGNNNPTYILPIDPYNYMPFFNSYSNVNPFASFYPTPQTPLANNPSVPWNPQMYSNPNMFGPNPLYPWTAQPFPLYVSPSTQNGPASPSLLYPFGMSPFPPPPAPTGAPPAWLQLAQSKRAESVRGAAVARHLRTSLEHPEKRTHSIDQSVVHVHPTYASMHPSCDGCSFLEVETPTAK
jgi:hypothetical protein